MPVIRLVAACAAVTVTGFGPLAAPALAQEASDAASQTSASAQEARFALAQSIIDISFPEETRFEMFNSVGQQIEAQVLQSVRANLGDTPPEILAALEDWQRSISAQNTEILRKHVPDVMRAWIKAYANTFSERELTDILAFVQTPSGLSFMQQSTDILSDPDFAAANQLYIDETMALMQQRLPDLRNAIIAAEETSANKNE